MNRRRIALVVVLVAALFVWLSFTETNPYFVIAPKDVVFKTPKGFPKPVYTFQENKPTPAGFVLGRKLFYDPVLSRDSSTSCASCHQRFAAFAHIDHALSHGINGLIGKRNVPALQNLIWQPSFMWDGGVNHIELQPISPITNSVEMDETLVHIIGKLKRNEAYLDLFKEAFGDTAINTQRIMRALTQFTGLMISNNSRYDKYLRKEEAFTEAELNGSKLFRMNCANCHPEPLFTDNSFRNNGLKADSSLKDYGRYMITGLVEDSMKFKVPSLRNVALTYPYMHDGRFKNLQQVLDHYSFGISMDTGLADKSLVRLKGLSLKDKADIIAFLKTLTDKVFAYDRRFADPNFR